MEDSVVTAEATVAPVAVAGRWRRRGRQDESTTAISESASHEIVSAKGTLNDRVEGGTANESNKVGSDIMLENEHSAADPQASVHPDVSFHLGQKVEAPDASRQEVWSNYRPGGYSDVGDRERNETHSYPDHKGEATDASREEPWSAYVSGGHSGVGDGERNDAHSYPDQNFQATDTSRGELWSNYRPGGYSDVVDMERRDAHSHLGDKLEATATSSEEPWSAYRFGVGDSESNDTHSHDAAWAPYRILRRDQMARDMQPQEGSKDEHWASYSASGNNGAWENYKDSWHGYADKHANSESPPLKDCQWSSYSPSQAIATDSRIEYWDSRQAFTQECQVEGSNPWSSYKGSVKDADNQSVGLRESIEAQADCQEQVTVASKQMKPHRQAVVKKWWHALEGESCPISLTPIETLRYEPFGLLGGGDGSPAPTQGVWGKEAVSIIKSGHAVHWFDGAFLASFLVSGSSLMDPVNRRSLTRGECVSLDAYLSTLHLPAVHVTDAYDLLKHVSGKSNSGRDPSRMAALEREAATLLGSLFDFRRNAGPRSNKSGAAPSRTKPTLGPATGLSVASTTSFADSDSQNQWQDLEVNHAKTKADDASWPTLHSESSAPPCSQVRKNGTEGRSHHDDLLPNESSNSEDERDAPEFGGAGDPTPAEAMRAMGIVGTSMAASSNALPRVPRSAPRTARGKGGQRCTNAVNIVKKSPVEPADEPSNRKASLPVKPEFELEEPGSCNVTELCDVHVPDWASVELHQRTLDEFEAVEAMFPEELELLTPTVRRHLETCIAEGSVSSRAEALRFRLLQRIDAWEVLIEFSLPPFYPSHSAMVELSWPDSSDQSSSLLPLERAIRKNVLQEMQSAEVVLAVLEWLDGNGSVELAAIQAGRQEKRVGEGGDVPPALAQAVVAESSLSKQERIEQARAERMAGKYSDSWDLCYAFVKHGSCKDKNCAWRHAIPGKEKR